MCVVEKNVDEWRSLLRPIEQRLNKKIHSGEAEAHGHLAILSPLADGEGADCPLHKNPTPLSAFQASPVPPNPSYGPA